MLAANLLICSGFRMVLWVLRNDCDLTAFIAQTRGSRCYEPLPRLAELLDDRGDPAYRHPHDAALTAYLYVLAQVNPQWAVAMAQVALERNGLFWARQMAEWCLQIQYA